VPAADLTPGFFGKIPTTGDFVSRRLAGDFVRFWDHFAARHLVPLLAADRWRRDVAIGFLLGREAHGPMTGLVLASCDRIGRRFPLTVAVPLRFPSMGIPAAAADWFAAIHEAGRGAQEGRFDADELAAELAMLPFPADGAPGAPAHGLVLWTNGLAPVEVDPDAPQVALERIFAFSKVVG
jgi:type VI secretion system protein ImpM